jgi:CheY-like chemotaxis protein
MELQIDLSFCLNETEITDMDNSSRILLIDDDPLCHLIAGRMIKEFSSFEVEAFTNAQEALEQLKTRGINEHNKLPDYILLDIDMPRMNGWQFLEEFQKLSEHVIQRCSVIILSSSNHYQDIEKSKRYPAVKNFFSKPLTADMVKTMTLQRNY